MTHRHPDIPVLDLTGPPQQMGAAHGEAQREKIRAYVDRFLDWVFRRAGGDLNEEKLWEKWSPQVTLNERVAPALVDEMRGIARGAGVSFEKIFLLNSLLDLVRFCYPELGCNFGCTTFAVSRSADGAGTLVGQTYDLPAMHHDYLLLLRLVPDRGPRQLVFTFSGIVGACGLNDAGIGLSINFLSPTDSGLGQLHSVVVRQTLAAENLAQALAAPVVPPRAGGAHYLVADREGNVASIETTAKRHWVFYPDDNAIGHTNHYLAPHLKEVEYIRHDSIGSSLARYTALRRYFQTAGGHLDLAAIQELTRNHNSFPKSICAHGPESDPQGDVTRTLAAMIHVLDQRTMHITGGCACETSYHAVQL